MNIETVIFDIGGVLIDWNPRYLYKKLLKDETEIEFFLNNFCTAEWNAQQDAGRSFRDGVAMLQKQYPQYAGLIEAYDRRWEEMLGEADWEAMKILGEIKQNGVPVYALTNWSAEKFPLAKKRYDFLNWFDGILVSGEVGLKKPDLKIFRLILENYQIEAGKAIYLDDVMANIKAADEVGFRTIHFQNAAQLREALRVWGILSSPA